MTRILLVLLFLVAIAADGNAQQATADGVLVDGSHRVHLALDAWRGPQGVEAALEIGLDDGWHVYWRHAGGAGLATTVTVDQHPDARVRFAPPRSFHEEAVDAVTFGYADVGHVLIGPLPEHDDVDVAVDLLACNAGNCVPFAANLHTTVRSDGPRPQNGVVFPHLVGPGVEVGDNEHVATLTWPCADECPPEGAAVEWFPANRGWQVRAHRADAPADHICVELQAEPAPPPPPPPGMPDFGAPEPEVRLPLDGAVVIRHGGRVWAAELDPDAPVAVPEEATPATETPFERGWLRWVWVALLGGLLLNLMPCVLPVLAIKVTRYARQAHVSRRTTWIETTAYALAVVASIEALALLMLGLRAGGHAVGWGFQFHSPAYLVVMSLLLSVFAAGLFGLYHLPAIGIGVASTTTASPQPTVKGALLEGALTVGLATPCAAPSLGAAMGFAMTLPVVGVLAIFGAIGVGLAAPFVILAALPGATRWIPRPGPWMTWMERVLAGALVATALWLGSLFVQSRGLAVGGWLLMWHAVVWLAIIARRIDAGPRRMAWAGVFAGAIGIAVLWPASAPPTAAPEGHVTAAGLVWHPWSDAAVAEALASGDTVFVDFTASWCLTCKVNERTVLSASSLHPTLSRDDVRLFIADWTNRDGEILEALQRHGRVGVPMYLVYDPDQPDAPEVLSELLTVGMVQEALNRALDPR